MTDTVVERVSEPLVPVNWIVYVPVLIVLAAVIVKVVEPVCPRASVMGLVDGVTVRPAGVDVGGVTLTVPAKP